MLATRMNWRGLKRDEDEEVFDGIYRMDVDPVILSKFSSEYSDSGLNERYDEISDYNRA